MHEMLGIRAPSEVRPPHCLFSRSRQSFRRAPPTTPVQSVYPHLACVSPCDLLAASLRRPVANAGLDAGGGGWGEEG